MGGDGGKVFLYERLGDVFAYVGNWRNVCVGGEGYVRDCLCSCLSGRGGGGMRLFMCVCVASGST